MSSLPDDAREHFMLLFYVWELRMLSTRLLSISKEIVVVGKMWGVSYVLVRAESGVMPVLVGLGTSGTLPRMRTMQRCARSPTKSAPRGPSRSSQAWLPGHPESNIVIRLGRRKLAHVQRGLGRSLKGPVRERDPVGCAWSGALFYAPDLRSRRRRLGDEAKKRT